MRTIYLDAGRAPREKKWFIAAAPNSGDGGPSGGTVPRPITVPVVAAVKSSSPDPAHRPWLVPGVGKL